MEPRSITTHFATSNEAAKLRLAQGSKEVTPSSSKEPPSDIAIHSVREGIMGSKKRCKHHLQGALIVTDQDDDNNKKVGGSGVGHVSTTVHNNKHQVRPPTDHFKRLLEESYPNHA
jgi:hypothetical protein